MARRSDPGTVAIAGRSAFTISRSGVAGSSERQKRSEERRVGEEGRSRGAPDHLKKKKTDVECSAAVAETFFSFIIQVFFFHLSEIYSCSQHPALRTQDSNPCALSYTTMSRVTVFLI